MSRTKVKRLTAEQEALIPVTLEKWRAIALSTGPSNRSQNAEIIKAAYAAIGQKEPKIYFCDRPYQAAPIILSQIGNPRNQLRSLFEKKLRSELEKQLRSYLPSELESKLQRKYTLLRIDFYDDIDESDNQQPVYLLKMTCPSTNFIHVLRVPPHLRSAREAIVWVNWGIDPEEFSVQT